jgi:hypothetical protein
MMPDISKAATVAQTSEWRAERRTRLYHSCIDILVAQINDLTGRDIHIRYADKLVRRSRVFMDFYLWTVMRCPLRPREQLRDSDHVFPFRDTQEIRAELETERARLLNQDGTARDRCKDRVSF